MSELHEIFWTWSLIIQEIDAWLKKFFPTIIIHSYWISDFDLGATDAEKQNYTISDRNISSLSK